MRNEVRRRPDDPSEAVAFLRREPVDVLVCDAHLRAGTESDPVEEDG